MGDLVAGLGVILFVIVVICLVAGLAYMGKNWWWNER